MKMVTVSVAPIIAAVKKKDQEERRLIRLIKGISEVSKVKYLGCSDNNKHSFSLEFCGVPGWRVDMTQYKAPSRNRYPRYVFRVQYCGEEQMDSFFNEMRIVLKKAIQQEVNDCQFFANFQFCNS